MLSKETFVKSMAYLKLYYGEQFKVDFDNDLIVKVWLNVFKNINEKLFIQVIQDYVLHNEFAPSNPTFILKHIEKMYINKQENYNVAWENVLKLRTKYRDYSDGSVNMRKVLIELEQDSAIYVATKSLSRELKNDIDITQERFLKLEFKEIYLKELQKQVKQETLKLSNVENLKLGV